MERGGKRGRELVKRTNLIPFPPLSEGGGGGGIHGHRGRSAAAIKKGKHLDPFLPPHPHPVFATATNQQKKKKKKKTRGGKVRHPTSSLPHFRRLRLTPDKKISTARGDGEK